MSTWAKVVGWARCIWVYPGITVSIWALALFAKTVSSARIFPLISGISARTNMRKSTAT